MKKSLALLGAVASMALFASSASAAEFIYSFSGNGGANGAFGTLDATYNGDGTYTATTGTITAFGSIAAGMGTLVANPNAPQYTNNGSFIYDDQVLTGQNPLISNPGLLFSIAGTQYNIYSNGAGPGTYIFTDAANNQSVGNFSLSEVPAVPEAATWVMMIAGFGMIGGAMRKRSSVKTTVRFA